MPKVASLPRPALRLLAAAFAAGTVLYSGLWMYYVRWESRAFLGVEFTPPVGGGVRVTSVAPGSGAERAGVRPGDLIRAVNGLPAVTPVAIGEAVGRGLPGDVVRLSLERAGEPAPLLLSATLGPRPEGRGRTGARRIAAEAVGSFPVPFLVVGLVVLVSRPHDRNAWLLMLLFAGFIAAAPLVEAEGLIHPALRGFALAWKITFHGLLGASFYFFCAVFPSPSRLDRRFPWLKSALLGAAAAVALPIAAASWWAGSSMPLYQSADAIGAPATRALQSVYYFGASALALVSLVSNGLHAPTPQARRKTRVIVWGTVAAITPFCLLQVAAISLRRDAYELPFWFWVPCVLMVLLLPLSFAYAVVRHRVLEVPLLIRRSARYLLVQRGFTGMLLLLSALLTLVVAGLLSQPLERRLDLGAGPGIAFGVGFGVLMAWTGTRVQKRVTERIDRAFFRGAYDARQLLQELVERTSGATSRDDLRAQLAHHIRQALHPRSLSILLEESDGLLAGAWGDDAAAVVRVPASHPALGIIAGTRRPSDAPAPEAMPGADPIAGLAEADCLVPLHGRDGRLVGAIVLGERLSEDPYSREDKRLLASAAAQAALALENVRLAEQIAERVETERRAAVELDVAREVQAGLLPRGAPALLTLDCAGTCLQARAVGGDYYDFLELGGGQTGLVLADIAGKGIAGALLMANLQASVRSQCGLARDDLRVLMQRVNRLLCGSIAADRFATLFFGCYDDATRSLRYVNCGHNPPVVLRGDGGIERLAATATILGAFSDWDCALAHARLEPGDTLLLYSDGITEATDGRGEEFGETRLIESLRRHRALPAAALVPALLGDVQAFSPRDQGDDMTLIAARCV